MAVQTLACVCAVSCIALTGCEATEDEVKEQVAQTQNVVVGLTGDSAELIKFQDAKYENGILKVGLGYNYEYNHVNAIVSIKDGKFVNLTWVESRNSSQSEVLASAMYNIAFEYNNVAFACNHYQV